MTTRSASSVERWMSELGGWIGERRGELVALLQALIRARSENPPGNESAPAAIVRERLEKLGARIRDVEAAPGRTSVVGALESGSDGAALLADAHLDTVPAGPGWSLDPFAGLVRDGFIYGRGAIDHKSPIAALLYAAAALKEHGRLPRRLELVFDADEELGGQYGMRYLLRELDLDPGFALYAVPTSFSEAGAEFFGHGRDNVFVGSVGVVRLRATYATRYAYSVAPVESWNVPEVAAVVATELQKEFQAPPWFGGRPRARLMEASGTMQAWEVAVLPDESTEAIADEVRVLIETVVRRFGGATVEVDVAEAVPPATTARNSPLAQALLEGAEAATGRRPQLGYLATVTGMSPIQERLGVPIAAFGYGEIELCHVPDERIAVDDLVAASIAYAEAIARLP